MRKRIPIIPKRELILMALLSGDYTISRIAKTFDWKLPAVRRLAENLRLPYDEKGKPLFPSDKSNFSKFADLLAEMQASEQSE